MMPTFSVSVRSPAGPSAVSPRHSRARHGGGNATPPASPNQTATRNSLRVDSVQDGNLILQPRRLLVRPLARGKPGRPTKRCPTKPAHPTPDVWQIAVEKFPRRNCCASLKTKSTRNMPGFCYLKVLHTHLLFACVLVSFLFLLPVISGNLQLIQCSKPGTKHCPTLIYLLEVVSELRESK